MPDELKPVLARQMEVYAGFLEHTDHHIGRLIDALEDLGVLDDTLVYYIIGDNGASAEGTINGTFNEMFIFNGAADLETPEFMASQIDKFGGPTPTTTTPSAGRTPWTRRTSGRSRSPRTGAAPATARSCTGPIGIKARGEVRSPVPPRDRRRADRARGGRTTGAELRPRGGAAADGGREHGATRSTTRTPPSAARRSTSRCSATAASTTRAGPPSPATPRPG